MLVFYGLFNAQTTGAGECLIATDSRLWRSSSDVGVIARKQ